jgi:hypothetical protein
VGKREWQYLTPSDKSDLDCQKSEDTDTIHCDCSFREFATPGTNEAWPVACHVISTTRYRRDPKRAPVFSYSEASNIRRKRRTSYSCGFGTQKDCASQAFRQPPPQRHRPLPAWTLSTAGSAVE